VVVKHINGQLVDVLSGKTYPACVNFFEGKVVRIEHKVAAPNQYILPGLIDSRVHIESSSLTPYRFAEQAVAHGTSAVIADPTPVAAAMGLDGIRFLMEDGKATPLRFYYAAPSSLPESTGLGWRAVRELMARPEFVALGEVTEVADVLAEEAEVMAKMEVARGLGKPVDGFAPGLRGYDLDRYIMAGISSDHGCSSSKEAEEKQRRLACAAHPHRVESIGSEGAHLTELRIDRRHQLGPRRSRLHRRDFSRRELHDFGEEGDRRVLARSVPDQPVHLPGDGQVAFDRLLHGHVVDFLQVHWKSHYFPSFNVADSAITVGAVLLVLDELRRVRRSG
jgi:hypothetical protein